MVDTVGQIGEVGRCVYAIVHQVSGRAYVGSTKNLRRRMRWHDQVLRENRHTSPHLQNAWNHYGADAFTVVILESRIAADALHLREQHWIDRYRAEARAFNAAPTARWVRMTAEQLERSAAATRVRTYRSPEQREKIRQALLGRKASDTAREHRRGPRPHTRGPKSDEARAHMRAAARHRRLTDEQKRQRSERVSASLRRAYAEGRHRRRTEPLTAEHRLKVSAGLRARRRD